MVYASSVQHLKRHPPPHQPCPVSHTHTHTHTHTLTFLVAHSQFSSQRDSKVWLCEHHQGCPAEAGVGLPKNMQSGDLHRSLCLLFRPLPGQPKLWQLLTAGGWEGRAERSLLAFHFQWGTFSTLLVSMKRHQRSRYFLVGSLFSF